NPSHCVSAVQLVDFTGDALKQRGWFEHKGSAERVGVIGTRAYAMSQIGFQTVNIDDRDNPVSLAFVPFVSDTETPYFDGCGLYPGPVDPGPFPTEPGFPLGPINVFVNAKDILAALDTFASNGTCGAVTPVPLAGMTLGLMGFV